VLSLVRKGDSGRLDVRPENGDGWGIGEWLKTDARGKEGTI